MSSLPSAAYVTNAARTVAEMKQVWTDVLGWLGQLVGAGRATYTITAGVITPAVGNALVDTEGGAGTDDLTNIAITNLPEFSVIRIASVNSGRVVTAKNAAGGSGQMAMADSADLVLADPTAWVEFVLVGTTWIENARGYGNAKASWRTFIGAAALAVAQTFSGAQRGTVTALVDGATITPDFAVNNFMSLTIGGNRTLANPTNLTAGQAGLIVITQDGSGGRTLAFGSYWKFSGGVAPTLTATIGAVDVLAYYVESSTRISANLLTDMR